MTKKWITASEALARLEADPELVARRRERQAELRKREQELARAEAPLVEDLRAAGLRVESVWDAIGKTAGHQSILAILVRHLQRDYPGVIREGIARALGVREASFAWPLLVNLFKIEREERVKDGLAAAISNIVSDSEKLDELISLARDGNLGDSRVLLLEALEKSRLPKAQKALVELSADPQLKLEIESIFRRQRDRERRRQRRKGERTKQSIQ